MSKNFYEARTLRKSTQVETPSSEEDGALDGDSDRIAIGDLPISPATLGARVRRMRLQQGLTVRELADNASVDKNTIVRLEKGKPTSRATVTLVCAALSTVLERLLMPASADDEIVSVHTHDQDLWIRHSTIGVTSVPIRGNPLKESEALADAAQRAIAARAGESVFNCLLASGLPTGLIRPGILELYGESQVRMHPGEEFVLCLRSEMLLTVAGQPIVLKEGESASFWSAEPHSYAPTQAAVDAGRLPAVALTVRIDASSPARESSLT